MKRYLLLLTLILPLNLFAPVSHTVMLVEGSPINPYEPFFNATCIVESSKNPFAVNIEEQAFGLLQVRQCKLDDFNRATGKKYTLNDCFNPEISREIFMWHCSGFSPYDLESAARRWNGSGPKTKIYWKKVHQVLKTSNI